MNILFYKYAVINISDTLYVDYVVGAIIALFILGYLAYSLVKPEKF